LSSADRQPIVLGRVSGHRGNLGEVTVKVLSGDAAKWSQLRRVVLDEQVFAVASARAYRDRLVLKLAGVDDASGAAALRGRQVSVTSDDVPELPKDEYWVARLVGAQVKDEALGTVGQVIDVVETGGTDILLVKDDAGRETLVPLAKEFVKHVDERTATILVTLPPGLFGLNSGTEETA
jgi:16S rRNA processing protein RimM